MKFCSFKISYYFQRLWNTPLTKQCFVTTGVTLNTAALGLVMGFAVPLLTQLKAPDSTIPIDDEKGSWIASLPGIFMFGGNFLAVPIMGKYGRRTANLISISLLIVAWVSIIFAPTITLLLIARALQGVTIGMSATFGALLIGEYTSPRNRGAFLTIISVLISVGVMSSHAIGSFLTWQTGALVCAFLALINLVIVILSPESPYWLASQGKYEECRKVFRWLRGDTEEEELDKIIEACIFVRSFKVSTNVSESYLKKVQKNVIYFKATIIKKEFYKPLIIVTHIYTLMMWTGVVMLTTYPQDYFHRISGNEVSVPLLIITLDAQRIISNILAIYIIKKFRRRMVLLVTVISNIVAIIAIAVYSYAKHNYTLPFEHPSIGIILTHCVIFAIATGTSSLPYTIAGEIFPLDDKSLAGGIGMLVFTANLFVAIKTVTYRFANLGVHGALCINALILSYCLLVVWFLLPETKDKTLQDIEDEFRGSTLSQASEPDSSNDINKSEVK